MKSISEIRRDFPILERKIGENPLVYFDNGATSQKPQQVIDSIVNFYTTYNANIHRGVHTLSQEATEAYEVARQNSRSISMPPSLTKYSSPVVPPRVST